MPLSLVSTRGARCIRRMQSEQERTERLRLEGFKKYLNLNKKIETALSSHQLADIL